MSNKTTKTSNKNKQKKTRKTQKLSIYDKIEQENLSIARLHLLAAFSLSNSIRSGLSEVKNETHTRFFIKSVKLD
jgi:hypothetical protein